MTRPRVPLGLEASRTTLNRAVCAELGQKAKAARTARGLSVQEVAASLMLSPAQLAALENVQPEAFYGAAFYTTALKKYLKYLDLQPADAARALVTPVEPVKKPAPFRRSKKEVTTAVPKAGRSAAFTPTFVAAAVAASAVAGWWMMTPRRSGPTTASTSGQPGNTSPEVMPTPPAPEPPPPANGPTADPPAPEMNAADAAVSAVTAVSSSLSPVMQASELREVAATDGTGSRHGSITVGESTWIFVRYADNGTDERRIGPGDAFLFRSQPVYIAVGAAAGTTILVSGRRIDAAPFTTNGQIRIGKAFLGTLVAGR